MSTVVDERIVEMRFDNGQFEEGARESMATLSKLQTALNKSNSAKALGGLAKSTKDIRLDGIAAGVDALQKRFSVLGLVGMKAVNGIADALLNTSKKLYDVTIGQILSGGWRRAMNIENARFQLQALFSKEENAAELVTQVMEDANKAVDGTAYSLDAAAKAASQFAATGIQAGKDMQDALRGIVGVAAMTSSDFESISMIFTTVAGQGRVMGDQLNQLASRGLNAAVTIADFANGVIDGSIQASDEVTNLVRSFSKGTKLTEKDIRDLTSKGKISFKLFSEAMTDAFADSAEKANETFTGALSNVKSALARIGAGFISPLIAQNSEIVNLFNALRVKINEFKKAIVFDEEYGNIYALSKLFTDQVLKMAKSLSEFISNINTANVMRDVYYGIKTVTNVFKALWVITKPALMAMSGLITPIGEGIHTIMVALEAVTSRMIASEGTLTSIGEVLKAIVEIFGTIISGALKLVQKVFKPLNKETKSTTNGFKEFLDAIASGLNTFNNWLKTSPLISKGLDVMASVIGKIISVISTLVKLIGSGVITGISSFVKGVERLFDYLKDAKKVSVIVDSIRESFSKLSKISVDIELPQVLKDYIEQAKLYTERAAVGLPSIVQNVIIALKTLSLIIGNIGHVLIDGIKHIVNYGKAILNLYKDLLTIENIKKVFNGLVESGRKFLDFVLDSAKALTGAFVGGGIMYMVTKAISTVNIVVTGLNKAFTGLGKLLTSASGALDQARKTLKAYQHDLNATAILKIAAAIAVLSASLIALSFADSKRVFNAAVSLGLVGGVLLAALGTFEKIKSKTKTVYDVFNQLGKAVKWKAIGSALKSVGQTILMISGSIIAIALMYKNDADSMNDAVKFIGALGLCLVGLMTTMALLGQVVGTGFKNFAMAAAGVAAVAGSILIIVTALGKLFKMELPLDYERKLGILYNIMGTFTLFTSILTLVSNIGHGGKSNIIPALHLFASLTSIIFALKQLFKIELPVDYKKKLNILDRIFIELSAVMAAFGAATRIAGGSIKMGSTLLSLSALIITLVGALSVLTLLPMEKIVSGAIALSGVIFAISGAIALAGAFANGDSAKAILNMGILIGSITASIAILTILDVPKMLSAASALSLVIGSIGLAFNGVSKIEKGMSIAAMVAMFGAIAEIAYALYELSTQPWQGMLASGVVMALVFKAYGDAFKALGDTNEIKIKMLGEFLSATLAALPLAFALYLISDQPWDGMFASGVAMGITLTAYANAFKNLGRARRINIKQVGSFVSAAIAAIPLALSLAVLSDQPWDGMLASGVAMSAVLMAFSEAFGIMSKAQTVDIKQIGSFVLASLSAVSIGAALLLIANQPWDGLLAAGVALSATLAVFSGCLSLISKANIPDIKATGSFVAASLALIPIALALKIVSGEPWQELLGAAASLSLVLVALSATMALAKIAGAAAKEALIGLAVLAAYIAGLVLLIGLIGGIVNAIDEHFNGNATKAIQKGIEIINLVGEGLGSAIGSFIYGIGEGMTSKLYVIADNLSLFMEHLQPFTDGLQYITEDSIKGVMMLGKMVTSLTRAEIVQGFTQLLGGKVDFEKLGEQLSNMAPYLQSFSESVSGISPESVAGAKTVSEIMLALSESLPRVGGILDKVLGQKKTLTDFAVELDNFGPSIASFAESVKDVKAEAVEGAKAAAMIMLEVANNLPSTDGLVQKIFGEQKTLADFATELTAFGEAIVPFAEKVKDVKPEAVEGAAQAGMIMAALAEELPSQGGVLGWLLGDSDMATFGTQLESYGKSIVNFSEKVKDVKPESLNGVATATAMMSALSEGLPETKGVLSIFTGGTMDFEEFGKQLDKFGKSLAKFSESTEGLDYGQMNKASVAIGNLIELLKDAQGIDSDAMTNFALALSSAPGIAIQEFITGIQNGDELIRAEIDKLFTNLNATINTKYGPLLSVSKSLINGIATALTLYLSTPFGQMKDKMIEIGEYVAQGLATGINNKIDVVQAATKAMAEVVETITRTQLQVNSPSKLAIEIGSWWPKSLAKGIGSGSNILKKTTTKMAKIVEDTTRDVMDIHSMSPRYKDIGHWVPVSLAEGAEEATGKLGDAVDKMADFFNESTEKRMEKAAEYAKEKASDEFGNVVYEVFGDWKGFVGKATDDAAKTLKDSTEKVTKASGRSQKKAIEQEKTYWEKLLAIKKAGVDAAKYKDMDLAKFQQSVLEEASEAWKNYIEQLSSTRDSIMSSVDLFTEKYTAMGELNPFDEIKKNEEEALTKDTLTKNLNDQIERYRNYYNTLQKLMSRVGEQSDFGDYLSTLKVDSYEQLQALNSMTDEELDKYVNSYENHLEYVTDITRKQNVKTKEQLVKGLTDQIEQYKDHAEQLQMIQMRLGENSELGDYLTSLGVESAEQLRVINSMTDEELTNYAQLYDTKMAYATNIASTQLTDLQRTTEAKLAEIFGGMADSVNLFDFSAIFNGTFESIDQYVTGIMVPLQEFKAEALRMSEELGPPIVAGFESAFDGTKIGEAISSGLKEGLSVISSDELATNAENLGGGIADNLSAGVGNALSQATFQDAAANLMNNLVNDLQTEAEIHSPSKLTEREVGQHLTEGIAVGINNPEAQASVVEAISSLISYLVDIFTNEESTLNECGVTLGKTIREGMLSGTDGFIEDISELTANTITELNTTWNENDLFIIGSNVLTFIQNGIEFIRPDFIANVIAFCEEIIDTFKMYLNEEVFNLIGQDVVMFTNKGVESVQAVLLRTCYDLCTNIIDTFSTNLAYDILFNIGELAMQGLEDGINSKLESIKAAAESVANAATTAMRSVFDINSPSRVAFEIGEYVSEGLALGIRHASGYVEEAGIDVSDATVESIKMVKESIDILMKFIEDGVFDPTLTITPIVDLSNIRSSVDNVKSLFNRATQLTANAVMSTSSSFNSSKNAQLASSIQKDSKNESGSNDKYTFNQYNYSPKALSRIDIYRRTQNQIRQFMEVTGR